MPKYIDEQIDLLRSEMNFLAQQVRFHATLLAALTGGEPLDDTLLAIDVPTTNQAE